MECTWLVNGMCAVKPITNVSDMEAMFQTNEDLTLSTAAKGTLISFDRDTIIEGVTTRLEMNPEATIYFRPHAGNLIDDLGWMIVPLDEILLISVIVKKPEGELIETQEN